MGLRYLGIFESQILVLSTDTYFFRKICYINFEFHRQERVESNSYITNFSQISKQIPTFALYFGLRQTVSERESNLEKQCQAVQKRPPPIVKLIVDFCQKTHIVVKPLSFIGWSLSNSIYVFTVMDFRLHMATK